MTNSRILVVDDEPAIRSFLVRVLEHEGYAVRAAHNGQEALRCLETSPFDLLLTDIKMDRLDGVELLREARSRYPDLAVILLTGHATVPSAIAALREGAYDYLLKPVKNEEIVNAVAAGLHERARQQRRDRLEQIASQFVDAMQTNDAIAPEATENRMVLYESLRLDTAAYLASLKDTPLDLTPTEFRLLLALTRGNGAALDYVKLVQAACGYTCTRYEAREIIGTHVLNLRQKLGVEPGQPYYVESMRGVGYRLIPPDETVAPP
jgi:DNA-binding response OmpR family regulator